MKIKIVPALFIMFCLFSCSKTPPPVCPCVNGKILYESHECVCDNCWTGLACEIEKECNKGQTCNPLTGDCEFNTPIDTINIDTIQTDFEDNDIYFALVSGGTFEMGCTNEQSVFENCKSDEFPVHTVSINNFYLSKHEVTNAQYVEFLNELGVQQNGNYNNQEYIDINNNFYLHYDYNDQVFKVDIGKEDLPVTEVTWYGASAYCNWVGGRLPTEAEWEYAARGGENGLNTSYSGSDNIDEIAWYGLNSGGKYHAVGTKNPNELGIYDLTGNVWEWCNDWYNNDYYQNESSFNNPQGPQTGNFKVVRGGAFGTTEYLRLSYRSPNNYPTYSFNYIGFRVAKDF